MRELRIGTAVDVALGPFLDTGDGFTAKTGLSITQPDVRLKKNGANWAQKSAAQTLSHEENGWYEVNLSTTDTGTAGVLQVACVKTGALPVWHEFMVLTAAAYDAKYAAAAMPASVVADGIIATSISTAGYTALGASVGGSVDDAFLVDHNTAGTIGRAIGDILAAVTSSGVELSAAATTAILAAAIVEPTAAISWPTSFGEAVGFLAALAQNKIADSGDGVVLRNAADTADIAVASVLDDGTTTTRGAWG